MFPKISGTDTTRSERPARYAIVFPILPQPFYFLFIPLSVHYVKATISIVLGILKWMLIKCLHALGILQFRSTMVLRTILETSMDTEIRYNFAEISSWLWIKFGSAVAQI